MYYNSVIYIDFQQLTRNLGLESHPLRQVLQFV